ncbi:MAG: hypothetical protein II586_09775, partial [Butyrivibrio sp.]|nr:hypothetical protein [Butyrivibrio sp.]
MGVNGITEVTNNIATTYASSVSPSVDEKNKNDEVKEKTQAAAVFEKSEEKDTQNVSSKETDRTKII